MIISRDKRFLFFAFNKTGTTSIEHVLSEYNSLPMHLLLMLKYKLQKQDSARPIFKHAKPAEIRRLMSEKEWSSYFKFGFVRNPWSRAVSLYNYHKKSPHRFPTAQGTFTEWLERGGSGTIRKSMLKFASDDQGNIILDFIGKYETLHHDFKNICDKLGLDCPALPHLNASTQSDYVDYYDENTRRIIAAWSREDIAFFKYKFGD